MLKELQRNFPSTLRGMATYQSRFGYPMLGGTENYYDVLKVPLNSSGKEIKRAYIELSKKYHPDSNGASCDPEEFVKVCEAYKILYKRASRNKYDSRMNTHFQMTPPFDSSYTGKNMQKSWEKFRAAMRSKQFGHNIPSFNGSTILHKRPIAIVSWSIMRMPISETSTESNSSILDRTAPNSRIFIHDWKLRLYMLGFGLVGLLLALDNIKHDKRKRPLHRP